MKMPSRPSSDDCKPSMSGRPTQSSSFSGSPISRMIRCPSASISTQLPPISWHPRWMRQRTVWSVKISPNHELIKKRIPREGLGPQQRWCLASRQTVLSAIFYGICVSRGNRFGHLPISNTRRISLTFPDLAVLADFSSLRSSQGHQIEGKRLSQVLCGKQVARHAGERGRVEKFFLWNRLCVWMSLAA